MRRFRFRTRTLLIVTAVLVAVIGGGRWWYNARLADHQRQWRLGDQLEDQGVTVLWTYVGPSAFEAWRWFDGPLFRRPTHAYSEQAADDVLAKNAALVSELRLQTLTVLGRQLVPRVRAAAGGKQDPLVETLRRHPTLEHLVIDASIRGTPVEYDHPVYTREDLAAVKAALPNLTIEWIEVN